MLQTAVTKVLREGEGMLQTAVTKVLRDGEGMLQTAVTKVLREGEGMLHTAVTRCCVGVMECCRRSGNSLCLVLFLNRVANSVVMLCWTQSCCCAGLSRAAVLDSVVLLWLRLVAAITHLLNL